MSHILVHLIAQDVKDIVFHLIEGEGAGKEHVHQAGIEPATWGSTVPRSTTELLVVEDIWREIR